MIGIYKITNPKGLIYIGQSVNIKKIFSAYKGLRCQAQQKIYASLLKYGVASHKFEIIAECEISDLNEKERYFQDLYQSNIRNIGLNISLVNTDTQRQLMSEETKKKISEKAKNRVVSEETRRKISIATKGERNPNYGVKRTEAAKLKISQAQKGNKNFLGKKKTPEHIAKCVASRKANGKQVTQEARDLMSKNRTGELNHFYGKKHTPESLLKMSLSQKGRKVDASVYEKIQEKITEKRKLNTLWMNEQYEKWKAFGEKYDFFNFQKTID